MGKTVAAAEFAADPIAFIEEIERTGERLTITRDGQPEVTLTAKTSQPKPLVLGALKDVTTIHGDLVGPVDAPS